METFKLTTREEVVKFLNGHYYLDVLRDYATTLLHFFNTRKEDFTIALNGSDKDRDSYNVKYHKIVLWDIGDHNGLEERSIDRLIAETNQWIADFDKWLEETITAELADPTTFEHDYDEDEEYIAVGYFLEVFEEKRMGNTYPYNPQKLMGLRQESAGLKDADEYKEMIRFYS